MRLLLAPLLALAIAAAACSDTTADTAAPTTSAPTTTSVETTTTLAPAESTTTTTATTTTTTVAATTTLPPFPAERKNLEHGGETWAVILAASEEFSDPKLIAATQAAASAGYNTGATDCDVGVAEALGLPEDTRLASVSVYFETEADAQAALLAFESRGISGVVATVFTYCLD
jgi:uncharacterized lipoprotein YbaY